MVKVPKFSSQAIVYIIMHSMCTFVINLLDIATLGGDRYLVVGYRYRELLAPVPSSWCNGGTAAC